MKQVKTSKNNKEYIEPCILGENSETKTFCILQTGPSLKIGRKYQKSKTPKDKREIESLALKSINKELENLDKLENKNYFELLECCFPKSQLTLDKSELDKLISYLQENHEPFKDGIKKYISVGDDFNEDSTKKFTAFFKTKDKEKLFKLILEENLIEEDLLQSVEIKKRKLAIDEFEKRLANPNLLEDKGRDNWQKWFQDNSWVLGSDIVDVLDERKIDTQNTVDYLVSSPGGYIDIIEIKRPQIGKMDFWATSKNHDNWIPSNELIKAITQASNYIYQVEAETNSKKFDKRVGCQVVKPRCTLIFGRSNDWDKEKYESFRILNSSYHNLTIMTYDQVLERAQRILEKLTEKQI
jgi:hypothetical protein